ncbi:hypothetical protein SMM_0515 [Spiroplasma mirum ATCC 29335]|nr:hypothetical protein SMM_0515 [Spiroplasma mirum ATCC 29335]
MGEELKDGLGRVVLNNGSRCILVISLLAWWWKKLDGLLILLAILWRWFLIKRPQIIFVTIKNS